MKKSITVFTPTYNRDYTLTDCYKSLADQTSKNFLWLIIDDGSSDNTASLIEVWKKENLVEIRYVWKENGGMHSAHNKAFELVNTELCFCLDSDDNLEPVAIERLISFWEKNKQRHNHVAGIMCNERYRITGNVIGTGFPPDMQQVTYRDLYYKHNVRGDKLLVFKTEIIGNFSYQTFEGERFVPLDYLYLQIKKPFLVLNENLYIKEYLDEGHSKNLKKTYARNPRGYGHYHKMRMQRITTLVPRLKSVIHYIGTALLAHDKGIIRQSPLPLLTILLYPAGYYWYLQLREVRRSLPPIKESLI